MSAVEELYSASTTVEAVRLFYLDAADSLEKGDTCKPTVDWSLFSSSLLRSMPVPKAHYV